MPKSNKNKNKSLKLASLALGFFIITSLTIACATTQTKPPPSQNEKQAFDAQVTKLQRLLNHRQKQIRKEHTALHQIKITRYTNPEDQNKDSLDDAILVDLQILAQNSQVVVIPPQNAKIIIRALL